MQFRLIEFLVEFTTEDHWIEYCLVHRIYHYNNKILVGITPRPYTIENALGIAASGDWKSPENGTENRCNHSMNLSTGIGMR